jgi:hypothetical protein
LGGSCAGQLDLLAGTIKISDTIAERRDRGSSSGNGFCQAA